MTIYVTERRHCCDIATDGELEELHAFAKKMGFIRGQFRGSCLSRYEFDHERKEEAIVAGAIPVNQADQFKLCWARFYRKHVTSIGIAWYYEDYREKIGEQKGVRVRINSNKVNGIRCYPRQYYNPTKSTMRRLLELAWKYEFSALYSMKKPRITIRPYREDE